MKASAALKAYLEYRPMQRDDLDAVLAIENRVYPFPWTRGNFIDSLESGYSAWVCLEEDVLVGYGLMMMVVDEAHLLNISVAAERQRSGLGGELLECLFEAAKAVGAVVMLLEVRPSNLAAQALYRRHGFREIGRRRDYYPAHGGREDAVLMERPL